MDNEINVRRAVFAQARGYTLSAWGVGDYAHITRAGRSRWLAVNMGTGASEVYASLLDAAASVGARADWIANTAKARRGCGDGR